jgi:hypothetical protein
MRAWQLTLKTVCGFGAGEIARAFPIQETAAAQRIVRAKRLIRERGSVQRRRAFPEGDGVRLLGAGAAVPGEAVFRSSKVNLTN